MLQHVLGQTYYMILFLMMLVTTLKHGKILWLVERVSQAGAHVIGRFVILAYPNDF